MIFITFNQVNNIFIFIFLGIIFGIIKNILRIIFLLKFYKKIKNTVINTIFYSFFACFFVFFINIFNFGSFSITLILAYILGLCWCEFVCKKIVVFCENKWYNVLTSLQKHKRKNNASKSKKS